MTDVFDRITTLKRPKTLVRAAQFAKASYKRSTHLPRLLMSASVPAGTACLRQIIEVESDLNRLRLDKDSTYNVQRHIEILAALLAESDALRSAAIFCPNAISAPNRSQKIESRAAR